MRLSDIIKGKVAVIDLWASWCMPCRAKAKAMIPIYEKYKDRGFEIVGVATGVQEHGSSETGYKTGRLSLVAVG